MIASAGMPVGSSGHLPVNEGELLVRTLDQQAADMAATRTRPLRPRAPEGGAHLRRLARWGCWPVHCPGRSGLLNPDFASSASPPYSPRGRSGAGSRLATQRHKQDISDIGRPRAVAERQHHHAARHRVDLLHRWIGPERIARPPAPSGTPVRGVGPCRGTFRIRSCSPPRNSTVPGALPGRQAVPCSIAGATRAAADGEPWGMRCGGRPGPPRVRWKVIQPAMSTATATPASRRQRLAGPAGPAGRRSGSRPPLMTSAAGSSGTMPTYPRGAEGPAPRGTHPPLG